MKFATKLMVVPYVNKLEDPVDKYLFDLDIEMSEILERKDISIEEKLSLYNQALQKFMYKNTSKNIEVIHKPREILETEQNTIHKKMKKKPPVQVKKEVKDEFNFKKEIKPEYFINQLDEPIKIDSSGDNSPLKNDQKLKRQKIKQNKNAPIIKRTQPILPVQSDQSDEDNTAITRNKSKQYHIPLQGDNNWQMTTNNRQGGDGFKWLSKKFF